MNLDQNILKQKLTNHIKQLNFNGGTDYFLNYIETIQHKYSNENLNYLINIRDNIIQCSREINTQPMYGEKIRGFKNVPSFVEYMLSLHICNIQDTALLSDLLLFFDDNILYTHNIRELHNLASRNEILIQENLNLNDQLKNVFHKFENLEKRLEQLININLLQNDKLSNIEENTSNLNL